MRGRCFWWISANERRQGGRGTRRSEQAIKYLMRLISSRHEDEWKWTFQDRPCRLKRSWTFLSHSSSLLSDTHWRAAMGSCLWGFVTDFFTYETTKSVVVKSWSVGIINRIVQLLIITYFVGSVFFGVCMLWFLGCFFFIFFNFLLCGFDSPFVDLKNSWSESESLPLFLFYIKHEVKMETAAMSVPPQVLIKVFKNYMWTYSILLYCS